MRFTQNTAHCRQIAVDGPWRFPALLLHDMVQQLPRDAFQWIALQIGVYPAQAGPIAMVIPLVTGLLKESQYRLLPKVGPLFPQLRLSPELDF